MNKDFGWPSDPILEGVNSLLIELNSTKLLYGLNLSLTEVINKWNVAVPGVAINFTSYDMTRRFRAPSVLKTGIL